jgi:hypothetical protein
LRSQSRFAAPTAEAFPANSWLSAAPQRNAACDWLQLCIDQDALAHPSDAGLRPAAAFSPHLSKIAGVLSG